MHIDSKTSAKKNGTYLINKIEDDKEKTASEENSQKEGNDDKDFRELEDFSPDDLE